MRAGTPAASKDSFMYWAAALLPSSLPRSAIVVAPPESGAGEAPVRRARSSRSEASSISAAAASATFDGDGSEPEASSAGCQGVFEALSAPSSSVRAQPVRSTPRTSTKTSRTPRSIASAPPPTSILRLTFLRPHIRLRFCPSPLRPWLGAPYPGFGLDCAAVDLKGIQDVLSLLAVGLVDCPNLQRYYALAALRRSGRR